MATASYTSFNSGELSPLMSGRTDIDRYFTGGLSFENLLPRTTGTAQSRSGSVRVEEAAGRCRLVKFSFSNSASYVLEFSNLKIRFYNERARIESGGAVEVTTPYLTAELDTLKFTQSADILYIFHNNHPPKELRRLLADGTSWELVDFEYLDGPYFDLNENQDLLLSVETNEANGMLLTASKPTFSSSDVARLFRLRVGEIVPTLIAADGVNNARFTFTAHGLRVGDEVVVMGSQSYNGRFAVSAVPLGNQFSIPVPFNVNEVASATEVQNIRLSTGVSGGTFKLSYQGATGTTAALAWNDSAANVLAHLESITAIGTGGVTVAAVAGGWDVTFAGNLANKVVSLIREEEVALTGGTEQWLQIDRGTEGRDGATVTIHIVNSDQASPEWGVGRIVSDFGSTTSILVDTDEPFAGTTATFNWRLGAFYTGNFPAEGEFFDGRLWLSNTPDQPQTFWASRSADFASFAPTELGDGAVNADNGITATIDDAQVNRIFHTVTVGSGDRAVVAMMHSGGVHVVRTQSTSDVLGPDNFEVVFQTSDACSEDFDPQQVGDQIVFMESDKRTVRAMQFNVRSDSFLTNDVTRTSEHVTGTGCKNSALQQMPDRIIWFVRDDGDLVSLTFEPQEQVFGFAVHDLGGNNADTVESVAVVRSVDNNVDEVWVSVNRGGTRQIEYFLPPHDTTRDSPWVRHQVDSAFVYDGRSEASPTGSELEVTITGGPPWTSGSTVNWSLDNHAHLQATLGAGDVGRIIYLKPTGSEDYTVSATIVTASGGSPATGTATLNDDLPSEFQATATTRVALSSDAIDASWLASETVTVVANGDDIGDQALDGSGQATLASQYITIRAGFDFTPLFQTMPPVFQDPAGLNTGRMTSLNHMSVRFVDTLGTIQVKTETDDNFQSLPAFPAGTTYEAHPTDLARVVLDQDLAGRHDLSDTVTIRQTEAYPFQIAAMTVTGEAHGR